MRISRVVGNGGDPSEKPPPPIPGSSLRSDHKRQGAFGSAKIRLGGGTDGSLAQGRSIGPADARQRLAISRQARVPISASAVESPLHDEHPPRTVEMLYACVDKGHDRQFGGA